MEGTASKNNILSEIYAHWDIRKYISLSGKEILLLFDGSAPQCSSIDSPMVGATYLDRIYNTGLLAVVKERAVVSSAEALVDYPVPGAEAEPIEVAAAEKQPASRSDQPNSSVGQGHKSRCQRPLPQ